MARRAATAAGLLAQARSELKRMERDLARVRRLVASAADEIEQELELEQERTPEQEGHRDEHHRSTAAAHV